MKILAPRHEVGGAMDNNDCQLVVNRPIVGGDAVSSSGDRLSVGLLDCCFRGRC